MKQCQQKWAAHHLPAEPSPPCSWGILAKAGEVSTPSYETRHRFVPPFECLCEATEEYAEEICCVSRFRLLCGSSLCLQAAESSRLRRRCRHLCTSSTGLCFSFLSCHFISFPVDATLLWMLGIASNHSFPEHQTSNASSCILRI